MLWTSTKQLILLTKCMTQFREITDHFSLSSINYIIGCKYFWNTYYNDNSKCLSENSILVQTFSDLFRRVETCSDLFKFVQTSSKLFKLVQTCSNLFNLFKLVQTCSNLFNLFKLVQTFSDWYELVPNYISERNSPHNNLWLSNSASFFHLIW